MKQQFSTDSNVTVDIEHKNPNPYREKVLSALFYGVSSLIVIFTNKLVMSTFQFPHFEFLASIQFISTSLILLILISLKKIEVPMLNSTIFWEILPVSLMFLGNVICGLGSTKSLNLPMLTALRRFSIFMTMLCEWFILNNKPSSPIFISILLMVGGALFAAMYDLSFDYEGYLLVFLNNLFTALNGVWMKKASLSGKTNKMGLLFYNSLFSAVIMFLFFFGEHFFLHHLSPSSSSSPSLSSQTPSSPLSLPHRFLSALTDNPIRGIGSGAVAGLGLDSGLRGAGTGSGEGIGEGLGFVKAIEESLSLALSSSSSSHPSDPVLTPSPASLSLLSQVSLYPHWSSPSFLASFLLASLMGSVLNYSIFLCTTHNSALTTAVVGCLKNVLTTYISILLFSDYHFNLMNFIGVNLSIAGSLYYTYLTIFKGMGGFVKPQSLRGGIISSIGLGSPTRDFQLETKFTSQCPGYTKAFSMSGLWGHDSCSISLCPNETLRVDMCDLAAGCEGDTLLRLFDASKKQVAIDDNGCPNAPRCSLIVYTAPANSVCQTYDLQEACYSVSACGGSPLVTIEPTPAEPPSTVYSVPTALCDLIASTNIQTLYPEWSCANTTLASLTYCDWFGVSCVNGEVIAITLSFLANPSPIPLLGSLPTSIGTLSNLTDLTFSYSGLSGPIPSEIGLMTNLVEIWLQYNQLTGPIPSSIGNLTKLLSMALEANHLSGTIPSELGRITRMSAIWLDRNWLTGTIPPQLSGFHNVLYFATYLNRLTGTIPTTFNGANFPICVYLVLGYNHLSGTVPSTLSTIRYLNWLLIEYNLLTSTLPSQLSVLPYLTKLQIFHNSFTGPIPTWLGRFAGLEILRINSNQFTGTVPTQLGNLKRMQILSLDNNQLTGSFPTEICTCPSLKALYISNNQFPCYPSCLMTDTQDFTSSMTRCIDQQDAALCALASDLKVNERLSSQVSYENYLMESTHPRYVPGMDASLMSPVSRTFNVPKAFKYRVSFDPRTDDPLQDSGLVFPDITVTYQDANGQTQTLSLSSLEKKYACIITTCYARLILEVPVSSFVLTVGALTGFSVFSGVMNWGFRINVEAALKPGGWQCNPITNSSDGFCNWPGVACDLGNQIVSRLSLPSSGLTGPFPPEISMLTGLRTLDLSSNLLTSTLPSSISKLVNLKTMDLSFNRLAGSLPTTLGSLSSLQSLALNSNFLTGSIPHQLASLAASRSISLSNNRLTGKIASSLCPLSQINATLDLGYNPDLTCFETCWGGSVNKKLVVDESVLMCAPTSQPTGAPSTQPSGQPTSQPSSPSSLPTQAPHIEVVTPSFFDSLAARAGVGAGAAFVFVLLVTLLYCFFRPKPLSPEDKMRLERLLSLPLHKAILDGSSAEVIRKTWEENANSVTQKDFDGHSVVDCLLLHRDKQGNLTTLIEVGVFAQILEALLPFNPLDGTPLDPSQHLFAWATSIQQDDSLVKLVVEKVLEKFRRYAFQLSEARDNRGRRCRDIASPGCRRALDRILFLHGRYELNPGPPEHKSHTSIVVFATEHFYNEDEDEGGEDQRFRRDSKVDPKKGQATRLNRHAKVGSESGDVEMSQTNNHSSQKEKKNRSVAIKFMKNHDQYLCEVENRKGGDFDEKYVIGLLANFDGRSSDPDDQAFCLDAAAKGFSEYPHVIVMEAAELNMKTLIDKQSIAGEDWPEIKNLTRQLAQALDHMHRKGYIHGDIKPINIMKVGPILKLIDLDASASFGKGQFAGAEAQYAGAKFSSAYVPPELLKKAPDGTVSVRTFERDPLTGLPSLSSQMDSLVMAHPSQDMWALGGILYLLCNKYTIFQANTEDNVADQESLSQLFHWTHETKQQKLSRVSDPLARNLLSLLLSANPAHRPSPHHTLEHPFLSGKKATRLRGEKAKFDVFLSYRVASDQKTVQDLYTSLTGRGLRVWWDARNLPPGKNWEEGFCSGLMDSENFVCVVSRQGMNHPTVRSQSFSLLEASSPCDNVLLEWRLALELRERGMISGIYPVFVGDEIATQKVNELERELTHFFNSSCAPACSEAVVGSVEDKVSIHLDREGLGLPLIMPLSVKKVWSEVTASQGGFLQGPYLSALKELTGKIEQMVASSSSSSSSSSIDNNQKDPTPDVKNIDSINNNNNNPNIPLFTKRIN